MSNYKTIYDCWDGGILSEGIKISIKDSYERGYKTGRVVRALIGAALVGAGHYFRNKRQKELYTKVINTFPDSKSLKDFLNKCGKVELAYQLKDDMDFPHYSKWVKKNIVKKGNFFRILAQFFMTYVPPVSLAYNVGRYGFEHNRPVYDSILANT